jgi:hypothetical protein
LDLLARSSTSEREIQRFLEMHPEFLLGDEYSEAVPQVVLKRDDAGPLIPDFILKPVVGELCDIAELKTAASRPIRFQKIRDRFSAAVYEAVAQLREYRDYVENEARRYELHDRTNLLVSRPRMFVVIGRRTEIRPEAFRRLEGDLPSALTLRTYDDLLERMSARISRIDEPKHGPSPGSD